MNEKIQKILSRNYPVLVSKDEDSGMCVVQVVDWPGCQSHGPTVETAFRRLEDAKYTWAEDCIERGIPIPDPRPDESFSGRLVARLPRSLHRRLSHLAKREGVSLNSLIVSILSEHFGARSILDTANAMRTDAIQCLREVCRSAGEARATAFQRIRSFEETSYENVVFGIGHSPAPIVPDYERHAIKVVQSDEERQ